MTMGRKESAAWGVLRAHIKKEPGLYVERIENVMATGTPDVNFLGMMHGTIQTELKAKDEPARANTPVMPRSGYQPAQINWHAAAARTSTVTFVLVAHHRRQQTGRRRGWQWYLFESRWLESSWRLPRPEFVERCCVVSADSTVMLFDVWRKYLDAL